MSNNRHNHELASPNQEIAKKNKISRNLSLKALYLAAFITGASLIGGGNIDYDRDGVSFKAVDVLGETQTNFDLSNFEKKINRNGEPAYIDKANPKRTMTFSSLDENFVLFLVKNGSLGTSPEIVNNNLGDPNNVFLLAKQDTPLLNVDEIGHYSTDNNDTGDDFFIFSIEELPQDVQDYLAENPGIELIEIEGKKRVFVPAEDIKITQAVPETTTDYLDMAPAV